MAHRVLHRGNDVIQVIFENLSTEPMSPVDRWSEERSSLARLAYTCKAFSPCALKILWRSLPSMMPLLSLLASSRGDRLLGGKHVGEVTQRSYSLVLKEPIAPESVLCFKRYASLVRVLRVDGLPHYDLAIFSYLEEAGLRSPLLPSLQDLSCRRSRITATTVGWVIGPSLRSFSAINYVDMRYQRNPEGVSKIESLLNGLHLSSPRLEVLEVADRMSCWNLSIALALSQLRVLDISRSRPCDTDFLRSLAALPRLHTLKIPEITGQPSPVPGGFRHLMNLAIVGDVDSLAFAVETIHPHQLRTLSVMIREPFECVDDAHGLFPSICNRCSRTLEEINIEYDLEPPEDEFTLTDILEPFHAARNVRVFTLTSEYKVSFSDADLVAIAKHWPALRALDLDYEEGPQLPTLWGIADLAGACPDLEEIALAIVEWPLQSSPPDKERDQGQRRAKNLKRLKLGQKDDSGQTRGADPRVVASVVRRLFPVFDLKGSREMVHYHYNALKLIFGSGGTFWRDVLAEMEKLPVGN
ncbi:hypothetical protein DAEQUDRAFT_405377 [Daedalea quercina L-15889]|uniref:F-box domain-containing protein n=1 Tax=Daedalea quercina L-15889 TaxID=1314783 RepID=A0A165NMK1_9APHY|nr:hypothetical protein DAEQUDRAFT_405377 [Daedalea quercina L-15889]